MVQSSFVPFKQSLIFSFTPIDRNKTLELRFDKDYREFGRLSLKLDSQYLSSRFEIEKWFELEHIEKGSKAMARISITVMKYTVESSRSRPSLKQNNFFETNKPMEGSPRLSYITNRLSNYGKSNNYKSIYEDKHYSEHHSIADYHNSDYMSAPNPSISSRHLDLKINLQNAVKHMEAEISPKEHSLSMKSREHKFDLPIAKEPLTYRDREPQEKRPASRKTKSLEKPINLLLGLEKDLKFSKFDQPEDPKPNSSSRRSIEVLEDENKELKSSIRRYEERESELRKKDGAEKYIEHVLKDGNTKLKKENRKMEQLIWDMERTRDKYESQSRKTTEKLDHYIAKCSSLERELAFTQNQLSLWKSKSEIIKLLENELEGLRRIMKERDRSGDMERILTKKRTEFEKALRDLQEENIKYREKLERLEDEKEDILRKSHQVRLEKEKVVSENISLKARIAALEMNEEQLRSLGEQKQEVYEEIEMLRSTNKQLRDLIMDQKNTLSHNEEKEDERFTETINKLQRKVEGINSQSLSHLQNVHSYLVNNFDLKNNLEKLEEAYGLDEEDSDVEIQEPEVEISRKASLNVEAEIERNQDMIKTFTDNNRRLEKYIHDAKTLKRENITSGGKFKSVDFHINGVGPLKSTQSASILTKPKIERSEDLGRKQIYLPVKDDTIDLKLGEYINANAEARKLSSLFKRKIPGIYLFGTRRVTLKVENGKLYIKAGQSYLSIESFVSLNLDLEHERMLAENFKFKKMKDRQVAQY